MRFRPFRFVGETYEADGAGSFRLRRHIVFERIPSPEGSCRFRAVSDREEMPREEQEQRDRARRTGPLGDP